MASKANSQAGRKRAARMLQDGARCFWCHCTTSTQVPVGHPRKAVHDHLVTQSTDRAMGYLRTTNLVQACWTCNSKRGDMPVHLWIEKIRIRQQRNGHYGPTPGW